MENLIYPVFKYLTDVPVNFWFWCLLLVAPALVLAANPETSFKIRLLRLILAIGFTYVLINLSLHTSRQIEWKIYEECQSQFDDASLNHHKECGEINIADGASSIFYAFFGWIPATAYVGLWELIWLAKHRKKIREIGKNYEGKWFSLIIFIISIPVWLYVLAIIIMFSYIFTCHLYSSSDKCYHSHQVSPEQKN